MKAVLIYEMGNATMDQVMAVFPKHKAVMEPLVEKKEIIGIGPFDGGKNGSMGIFKSREAAEAFVKVDPFVLEGVVSKYTIYDWGDRQL
jgi:uncharacterized protein YciI